MAGKKITDRNWSVTTAQSVTERVVAAYAVVSDDNVAVTFFDSNDISVAVYRGFNSYRLIPEDE